MFVNGSRIIGTYIRTALIYILGNDTSSKAIAARRVKGEHAGRTVPAKKFVAIIVA